MPLSCTVSVPTQEVFPLKVRFAKDSIPRVCFYQCSCGADEATPRPGDSGRTSLPEQQWRQRQTRPVTGARMGGVASAASRPRRDWIVESYPKEFL